MCVKPRVSQRFSKRRWHNSKNQGKENGRLIFSPVNRMQVLLKETTFREYCTSFSQVASLIGRSLVGFAAKKRHTDRYCQTLDTWMHLIVLLFCHMAGCQSLRDICKGLQGIRGGLNHLGIQKAPSRNALRHQNAKCDAMAFRDIYRRLHKRLGQQRYELCCETEQEYQIYPQKGFSAA